MTKSLNNTPSRGGGLHKPPLLPHTTSLVSILYSIPTDVVLNICDTDTCTCIKHSYANIMPLVLTINTKQVSDQALRARTNRPARSLFSSIRPILFITKISPTNSPFQGGGSPLDSPTISSTDYFNVFNTPYSSSSYNIVSFCDTYIRAFLFLSQLCAISAHN